MNDANRLPESLSTIDREAVVRSAVAIVAGVQLSGGGENGPATLGAETVRAVSLAADRRLTVGAGWATLAADIEDAA